MKNKTIADFQGKWTATLNYQPPIVSKSFVLNVESDGSISGKETVTLEGNLYDQEIIFSGRLSYHQTYVILDLQGHNDVFGEVIVKATIDKELPEDGDGKVHYIGTFENEFLESGEKNEGLFNAYRVSP